MRILWITNIMMPPVCEALGMKVPAIGGWMYSSLKRLTEASDNQFAIATIYPGKELISREINGIEYYLLPLCGKNATKYNRHLEPCWTDITDTFKPDVVHIHGSEYPHGLAYVNACGPKGVVVSLQGIISSYARYYTSGIDYRSIKKCLTLRDFIKHDNILKGQQSFEKRGKDEIRLLESVKHIIGRTDWDKAHSLAINPNATYHYCGETLRDSFYANKWEYSKCRPHSIFVSQASYPIKGLHMLLKAMPLILRQYPDTTVYVAGDDPTARPFWRITGYGKYLKDLIRNLSLKGKVIFTGMIDEKQMCNQYLGSNVFVCCSSIENSPNSLGEAQLLGMPYVASFVGGVPEIVEMNHEVLYRFEEYEMLASKICHIFHNPEFAESTHYNTSRYDACNNIRLLTEIYKQVANDSDF